MMKDFTMQELSTAIKRLKVKKAPCKDGITDEMIIRLGHDAKKESSFYFNQFWMTGKLPNQWRKAVIIPNLIHTKAKTRRTRQTTDLCSAALERSWKGW